MVAVERLPELRAIHAHLTVVPIVDPPPSRIARSWSREGAIAEIVRGRLTVTGPITAPQMADALGITAADAEGALLRLEADGVVLRGRFTPGVSSIEWCDRTLLARIHRYTLNRLRAELSEKDNLLIYYAGHGYIDTASDTGFWLPIDAQPDNEVNWISISEVTVAQIGSLSWVRPWFLYSR